MIFLWQQRSRIPATAEWDALCEAAPILDDEGPEMRAVYEHYMLHRNYLERAFKADSNDLFFHMDRANLNASTINWRCSSYNVGGILNSVYCMYCSGAPFERL